ncbi:MAG: hypothetical protein ABI041_10720 [Bdellovibrionia bacterium]
MNSKFSFIALLFLMFLNFKNQFPSGITVAFAANGIDLIQKVEGRPDLHKAVDGTTEFGDNYSDLREKYINEFRIQELIWLERSHGMFSLAEKRLEDLEHILRTEDYSLETDFLDSSRKTALATFKQHPNVSAVVKAAKYNKNEVAAYRIDQLFGFDLVPVTILRQAKDGSLASFQFYLQAKYHAKDLGKGYQAKSKRLKFFDFLINNTDRHLRNWMYTSEGKEVAIDHDHLSFVDRGLFRRKAEKELKYPGQEKMFPKKYVLRNPSEFFPGDKVYSALKSTSDRQIREVLKDVLSRDKVRALIERKNLYLKAVEGKQLLNKG